MWLNGVHPKRTEGADVQAGTTADQIAAAALGQETPLPSLELALENSFVVGNCDNGYSCVYTNTFAWRTPTTPLPMEHNPRVVFERLFGEGGTEAQRVARLQDDRSILDAVREDMARLDRTLGAADRSRVTQYLDAVREIERRIRRSEAQSDAALPEVLERPVGIPESFDEHARLMFDLQALAFQADITRVFTFLIGREQTAQSFPEIGVPDPHHAMSHHQMDAERLEKYAMINTYEVSLLAGFLEKLQATPDGDGTLLDPVDDPLRRRHQRRRPALAPGSAADPGRRRCRDAEGRAPSDVRGRDADDQSARQHARQGRRGHRRARRQHRAAADGDAQRCVSEERRLQNPLQSRLRRQGREEKPCRGLPLAWYGRRSCCCWQSTFRLRPRPPASR